MNQRGDFRKHYYTKRGFSDVKAYLNFRMGLNWKSKEFE